MQSWQDMTTAASEPVNDPSEQSNGASGLSRDVELLRCLATPAALANGGMSVTRLAEATRRDSSQVSRVMRALENVNLVERDSKRNYRIGSALFALAAHAADDHLFRIGTTTVETLAMRIHEPVHLCTLVGTMVRTLATRTPQDLVQRPIDWQEHLVPAHTTSAGRVLLGDFTRIQLEARFANVTFEQTTKSRVVDVATLWSEVQRAHDLGYALVDEEFAGGWVGASAPVRDYTGRIVAAINVAAEKDNWPQGIDEIGRMALAAANELSSSLGHLRSSAVRHLRPI